MPYLYLMRFHKPIGIFLLLAPTLWALWIAAQGIPSWHILLIFVVGTVVMRAAGCVINDIADRHLDKYVERTQQRPLAQGIISVKAALLVFGSLCVIALVLVLLLDRLAQELAIIGIGLTIIYPFLKRYTNLPQAWLGLAFAWGIPMAFAAQTGQVPDIAWLLLIATALWIIAYDTEYAMVDRRDDLRLGIKSTAILFASYDRLIIAILQTSFVILLISFGLFSHLSGWFYGGIGIAAANLVYQQLLIWPREPQGCLRAFTSNRWVGLAIFLGIVAAYPPFS